jgi:predicted membrane protein
MIRLSESEIQMVYCIGWSSTVCMIHACDWRPRSRCLGTLFS